MTSFGYTLMCEQSGPRELVRYAAAAEDAGFDFEVMSDHYFPWLDEQGHAPYAWSVLGAVSQSRGDLTSAKPSSVPMSSSAGSAVAGTSTRTCRRRLRSTRRASSSDPTTSLRRFPVVRTLTRSSTPSSPTGKPGSPISLSFRSVTRTKSRSSSTRSQSCCQPCARPPTESRRRDGYGCLRY
jgi:hypothetical protein